MHDDTIPGMQTVRPLRFCTQAQLDVLSARLASMVTYWQQEWGAKTGAQTSPCVNSTASMRPTPSRWFSLDDQAWLCVNPARRDDETKGPEGLIHRLLFGEDIGDGEIAATVAARAWRDLVDGLRQTLELSAQSVPSALLPQALPQELSEPWSGAARWEVRFGQAGALSLLLGPALVQGIVPTPRSAATPAGPVATLVQALAAQSVVVDIAMQPIEISLGELQSLQLGDVLLCRHRLDEMVSLRLGNELVGEGFLGRRGEQWAVEVQAPVQVQPQANPEQH